MRVAAVVHNASHAHHMKLCVYGEGGQKTPTDQLGNKAYGNGSTGKHAIMAASVSLLGMQVGAVVLVGESI